MESMASQRSAARRPYSDPWPHRDGARPPTLPTELIPRHVAVVMDGNGRWANQRGLPRTDGHRAGEASLMEVMAGAVEVGVEHVSVYGFSTENWRRSPEEVRFLMTYSRDALRRQRDVLHDWGVRIRWNGRRPRLWRSVIKELEAAEEQTRGNDRCTLTMCVNYGGRAEITDGVRRIAEKVAAGELNPARIRESTIAAHLDEPDLPDVDLFLRSSGEQRISNFLLWQSAYAEMVFLDVLWPDVDRTTLWHAIELYAQRDRRYGAAVDRVAPSAASAGSVGSADSASGA